MNCECFNNPMDTCGDLHNNATVCGCADYGIVAQGQRPFPS
jgi:hypothetical protein